MLSSNEIIIAAAGGGKTTKIVELATANRNARAALITYTQNNVGEIQKAIYAREAALPLHVEVWPWFCSAPR